MIEEQKEKFIPVVQEFIRKAKKDFGNCSCVAYSYQKKNVYKEIKDIQTMVNVEYMEADVIVCIKRNL